MKIDYDVFAINWQYIELWNMQHRIEDHDSMFTYLVVPLSNPINLLFNSASLSSRRRSPSFSTVSWISSCVMLESDSICKFLIDRRMERLRRKELKPEEKLWASSFIAYPFPKLLSPLLNDTEDGEVARDIFLLQAGEVDVWRFSTEQHRLDPNSVISIGKNIRGVWQGEG